MRAVGHRFTDITDKDTGEKKFYTKLFTLEDATSSDEGGQVPVEIPCDLEARKSLSALPYPCDVVVTKSRVEQKKTGSGSRIASLVIVDLETE